MANTSSNKVVSVLNELIETCTDGAKGFAAAAEDAEAANLKSLFTKYSSQRASFAADLDGFVVGLRGEPAESGHVKGAVHRGWLNLKSMLSGHDDKAILNECERGEDYAKKAYEDALKEELPSDVRAVVARQATDVRAAHDVVRDLRDKANGSSNSNHPSAHLMEPTEPIYRD